MIRLKALLTSAALLATAAPGYAATVNDGAYTAEQARRGQAQYAAECARCHGDNLGGGGGGPALSGPFWAAWEGRSVGELYHFTQKSMPADGPAGLSDQAYADILAYMLSVNHYPAGKTELPTNPEALRAVAIVRRP
jgi:mono/diheme cytochrome c family protein